jgi:hypothetical protein
VGRLWSAVEQLLLTGQADVVIVATRSHICRPLFEVADEVYRSTGHARFVGYLASSPVRCLARLGWTRIGSPGIFG